MIQDFLAEFRKAAGPPVATAPVKDFLAEFRLAAGPPEPEAQEPLGNARGSMTPVARFRRSMQPRGLGTAFGTNALGEDRGVGEFVHEAIPIGVGATKQAGDLFRLYRASEAYQDDKATQEQVDLLEAYSDFNDRPSSLAYDAGKVMSDSLQMLPGFAVGSGFLRVGLKKIAHKVVARKVKGALAKMAEAGVAKKLLAGITKTAIIGVGTAAANEVLSIPAQVVGGSSPVELGAIRMDIAERLQIGQDEARELWVQINGEASTVFEHLPAAFFQTAIEHGSEFAGTAFRPLTRQGAGVSVVGRLFEKVAGKSGVDSARKILSTVGVNGLVEEVGEEIYGALVSDALAAVSDGKLAESGNTSELFEPHNLAAMLLGIGGMTATTSLGAAAVGRAVGGAKPKPDDSPEGTAPEPVQPVGDPTDADSSAGPVVDPAGSSTPAEGLTGKPEAKTTNSIDEEASGPQPSAGPTPEAIEADVQAYRKKTGDESVKAVQVEDLEGQVAEDFKGMVEVAEALGVTLVPVTSALGELPIAGMSLTPGQILVDADGLDPSAVMWHELSHNLERQDRRVWEGLSRDFELLDPKGLAAALEQQAANGGELNPEEALAVRVEWLGSELSALASPAGRSKVVLALESEARTGALSRILNSLKELLAKLSPKLFGGLDTAAKRIAEAEKALQGKFDPKDAALAMKVHQALQEGARVFRVKEAKAEAVAADDLRKQKAEYEQGPSTDNPNKRRGRRTVLKDLAALGGIDLRKHLRENGKLTPEANDFWERFKSKEAGARTDRWLKGPKSRGDGGVDLETVGKLLAAEGWLPEEGGDRINADQLYDMIENELSGTAALHPEEQHQDDGGGGIDFMDLEGFQGGDPSFYDKDGAPRFAIAHHGGASNFSKFSTEFIGSGEGAQAFGWGLYFADAIGLAKDYKRNVASGPSPDQMSFADGWVSSHRKLYERVHAAISSRSSAIADNRETMAVNILHLAGVAPPEGSIQREFLYTHALSNELKSEVASSFTGPVPAYGEGYGYTVDLAPSADEYLMWDEPISAQSDKVQEGIMRAIMAWPEPHGRSLDAIGDYSISEGQDGGLKVVRWMNGWTVESRTYKTRRMALRYIGKAVAKRAGEGELEMIGGALYKNLALAYSIGTKGDGQKEASKHLADAGVRGNKYLDGSSRTEGEGTYNYVIFDEADVEITARFAKPGKPRKKTKAPKPGALTEAVPLKEWNKLDEGIENLVNRLRRVGQMREEMIRLHGKELADDMDVYALAKNLPGRIAYRIQELKTKFLDPIQDAMREQGLEWDDFNNYVWARHVPVANKVLADKHKSAENMREEAGNLQEDGGEESAAKALLKRADQIDPGPGAIAGMTTKDALKETAAYEAANPGAAKVADLVFAMTAHSRDSAARDGLISEVTRELWAETFENYVPLKTADDAKHNFTTTGFSVPGPHSYARMGRESRPDNVVTTAIKDAYGTVKRGETNQVGKAFHKSLTELNLIEETTELDPDQPQPKVEEHQMVMKFDGVDHLVKIRDVALARAMKNLTPVRMGKFLSVLHKFLRFQSSMITQFDPEFWVSNSIRDIQGALVNVSEVEAKGIKRKIVKGVLSGKAWGAVWRHDRGHPGDSVWDQMMERASKAGFRVSWSHMLGFEELDASLKKDLKRGEVHRGLRKGLDLIGDANAMIEMGTRLSVFKALVDAGVSDQKAALAARDITVDFNQSGLQAPILNSLYMFANASIQGNARFLAGAVRSKRVQKVIGGLMVSSLIMDALQQSFGPDDEDGKKFYNNIGEHVKDRNWVIMWPDGSGRFSKIPLPYGASLPIAIGRNISEWIHGEKDMGDVASAVIKNSIEAFSPIQGTDLGMALIPTIGRPFYEANTNENFAGHDISRTRYPGEVLADAYRGREDTPSMWKWMAQVMNKAAGGDEVTESRADFTPETLEHVAMTWMGGVGKMLERSYGLMENLAKGVETPAAKIPFIRRIYGEPTPYVTNSAFYDIRDDIKRSKKRIEMAKDRKQFRAAREWRERDKALLSLEGRVKVLDKRMRQLRTRRTAETDAAKRQAINEQINSLMARFRKEANRRLSQ